jgi:dipeptidyl aminopeptidase/acylaminoacyl peptidase
MRVFELPSFKLIDIPGIDKGIVGAVHIEDQTVSWSLSNARTPGLSYAYRVGSGAADPTPLTVADTQGIDLDSFPLPELVTYKSFDGLDIPAFIFLPPTFVKGQPIPFVVNFHGGPEGQSRPGFSAQIQFLLSRGYGVMLPNVRGSTGYGREFHMMDNYQKRWDSVKDGAEAARWLVKNGYAEAGKIAAYGGSYGGFMSVATVIEGSDVFGAAIDVVGIVNFKTFLEQTRDYRRKLREAEYGPLSDPEFLASVSPLNRVDEIKTPMMIAHGLNDPRVPVGEAMQLAVELQKRGYDPELLYFPDEGHGFAKLENRLLFADRMVKFLDSTIGE